MEDKENPEKDIKNFEDVIFHCSKCLRLVVNESIKIFKKRMGSPICNKCLITSVNCEKYFKDK